MILTGIRYRDSPTTSPNKGETDVTTETRASLPQPNDPVKEPIIDSPYEKPQWRWQLDSSTKAYAPALPGGRESQNIPPVAGSRRLGGGRHCPEKRLLAGRKLEEHGLPAGSTSLAAVAIESQIGGA